jgi:uncharacterized protein (DUF736 family)
VPDYDPNMKGVLFKNNKDGNEKRPDYRGSAVINNVDYNLSAWIKSSQKTGDKYMSIKIEPKGEGKLARTGEPQHQATKKPEINEKNWDDLDTPF